MSAHNAASSLSQSLRGLPNADLLGLHTATFRELRHRDQIAGAYWSREDMDTHFDRLCATFDPTTMEAHRANFRKFALRTIARFIAHDASFDNRVKRELHQWMKDHVHSAATPAVEDDSREFWEALGRPADGTG
jgi:hypothetical protein